jgi:hypothetical protein
MNPNQLKQNAIKGKATLLPNPSVISVVVHSTQATPLVPGQTVKLIDSPTGLIQVVACAADTEKPFGVVLAQFKESSYSAGDAMEIMIGKDGCVYMEAASAIARGVDVMQVITGAKVDDAAGSGKIVIGKALDKATAAGQLIRVMLDLPGTALP